MEDHEEAVAVHMQFLRDYTVPVISGGVSLGSGVMMRYGTRHIVATAAHCIPEDSIILDDQAFHYDPVDKRIGPPRCRIVSRWTHENEDLDIGFLEIAAPIGSEIDRDRIYQEPIYGNLLTVVGYPAEMVQLDDARKTINLVKSQYSSTIMSHDDNFIYLEYPEEGYRVSSQGTWPSQFGSPAGYSGGGCFGIAEKSDGSLGSIRYLLLGIQTSWHPRERWAKIVRAHHLLSGLKDRFGD